MAEFASVLDVAALDGTNGFRVNGPIPVLESGRSVSGGGDINGDGFDDVLIGAPSGDMAFIVFGAKTWTATPDLGTLRDSGDAYTFDGELVVGGWYSSLGVSISNAGDVNGDGFDDFIVGAAYASPDPPDFNTGAGYLVFGGLSNLELLDAADGNDNNSVSIANLSAATGYRFDGIDPLDQTGATVSGAGDLNGDGFADLLITAPSWRDYATPSDFEGASFIVFGGIDNLSSFDAEDGVVDGRIDLDNISGNGVVLFGDNTFPSTFNSGSGAVVGDVNGDGFDDLLVGSQLGDPNGTNTNEGIVYLIFGGVGVSSDTVDMTAGSGFASTQFFGVSSGDTLGSDVGSAGDINGDGLADIIIGAQHADPSGISSGSAYVVFGKTAFGASTGLANLNGSNGFRLDGVRASDFTGYSVSSAGDVNGDGFDDLLIGAMGFDLGGAAYVVFGKASGFAPVIDLGSLNGNDGFRIIGEEAGDLFGTSVSSAGDVNGDGFDDLVIGAPRAAHNGAYDYFSGSTYVIFGHRADTAVTRVGTSLDNTINGGKGDDSISGLSGDDTLIGWEGDDTISGSDGRDTIDGGDGNDDISGGSERDTFLVSAGEDHYDGGSEKDQFDFASYGQNAVTIDLATGQFLHFNGEDISTFVSVEDVKGTSRADTILGNFVNNSLLGRNGADTLDGREGNDRLTGGKGQDTQTGGEGKDLFIFMSELDSGAGANQSDTITDFEVVLAANSAFTDRIDLSSVDAMAGTGGNEAFIFIGDANFTAEGQIRATQSGADTVISINTTGTGGADMKVVLANFDANTLSEFDFLL